MWQHVLFWWGKGGMRQTAVKNILVEIMSVDLTCQTRLIFWMKAWGHPSQNPYVMILCWTLIISCHQQLANVKKLKLLRAGIVTPYPTWLHSFYESHVFIPTHREVSLVPWEEVGAGLCRALWLFLPGTQRSAEAARGSSVRGLRALRPGSTQIQV